MSEPVLLTARQVAEYLGFSVDTVTRWANRGELPGFRLGGTVRGRLRFDAAELDEWLSAHHTTTATPVREAPATRSGVASGEGILPGASHPAATTRGDNRGGT